MRMTPAHNSLSKIAVQSDSSCELFQHSQQRTNFSVSVGDFSDSVIIPAAVLDAIWSKAGDIISDSMAMCAVPGGHQKDRIVKSSSSLTPHVVCQKVWPVFL